MRQLLLGFLFFFTLSFSLFSQGIKIDNIRKAALRTSDAIKEGSDVKGYYFFYVNDKVDKNTNEYTLQIFDNNLKILKDIKFQESKDVTILESSFNGADLIFLFYNSKERTFDYQIYGADGKKKAFSYSRELTKKEKNYLAASYLSINDDEQTYKGLYPIEGKGFISNMPSREDNDYTFQIDYFASASKKQWTYTPTSSAKKFAGDYLGCYNNIIYLEVLKFSSLLDGKPDSYLVGLDLETGRQLFEKQTDSKNRFYPANMSNLNGNAYIFGEYFEEGANIFKDKSRGFAFWNVDASGKINSEKYCSWESDLGKYLNVSSNGKIDDFGFMYLHNMLQASDGSIYAIGEGYKKVASALGIASTVLSGEGRGGLSTLKLKVTDMILLKFDANFNVAGATIYEKNDNSIELQSGMEFVSTPLLGKMIKFTFGEFDYSYTQTNKDNSEFTVCYSDYMRSKDYKGGVFNSISYHAGKITTDQIKTSSAASKSWVLPGKQGQVLVLDYFKKEKRLDGHFEKLN